MGLSATTSTSAAVARSADDSARVAEPDDLARVDALPGACGVVELEVVGSATVGAERLEPTSASAELVPGDRVAALSAAALAVLPARRLVISAVGVGRWFAARQARLHHSTSVVGFGLGLALHVEQMGTRGRALGRYITRSQRIQVRT